MAIDNYGGLPNEYVDKNRQGVIRCGDCRLADWSLLPERGGDAYDYI